MPRWEYSEKAGPGLLEKGNLYQNSTYELKTHF